MDVPDGRPSGCALTNAYPEIGIFIEDHGYGIKLWCRVCIQDRLQHGCCSRAYMDVLAACPGGKHDIGAPPRLDETLVS